MRLCLTFTEAFRWRMSPLHKAAERFSSVATPLPEKRKEELCKKHWVHKQTCIVPPNADNKLPVMQQWIESKRPPWKTHFLIKSSVNYPESKEMRVHQTTSLQGSTWLLSPWLRPFHQTDVPNNQWVDSTHTFYTGGPGERQQHSTTRWQQIYAI